MSRKTPLRRELLRECLDLLVRTFDVTTIHPDPLELVLRFDDPRDQEIAGLVAAAFAYGRADIIVANIGSVLARMTPSPHRVLQRFDRDEAMKRFAGFAHRFHKTRDLVDLLERIAVVIRSHGSLGALFRSCYDDADADIGPSLDRFVDALRGTPTGSNRAPLSSGAARGVSVDTPSLRGGRASKALQYLLTSPRDGSACKRMNLYLRWMVRRSSPDLGLWTFVDPAKLVIPLDTHIHRITTFLGLGSRATPDWKAARRITDELAVFDPADPVRYDFALCRLGILDLCSRKRRAENCAVCLLRDSCSFPVAKSNRLEMSPEG